MALKHLAENSRQEARAWNLQLGVPGFKYADLNRVLNEPQYQPLPTLSIRLASVINCNTRHAGQIEYLRGLVKYKGWFPAAEK